MAPMACGIPDRQENRLIFRPCLLERLRPPRIPIHRIVRILKKVRAFLVRKSSRIHRLPPPRFSHPGRRLPSKKTVSSTVRYAKLMDASAKERYLEELKSFLRIASISTD